MCKEAMNSMLEISSTSGGKRIFIRIANNMDEMKAAPSFESNPNVNAPFEKRT